MPAKILSFIALCAAGAFLITLFWVRESDLNAAREDFLRKGLSAAGAKAAMMPKVFRRDFEIKLPLPGRKGGYRWRVEGRESASLDAVTDEILDFKGEMIEGGQVMRLSSPVVLFNREKRILSSKSGVRVEQSQWGKIEAREMVMGVEGVDPVLSGDVRAEIDREKVVAVQGASASEASRGEEPRSETPEKPAQEKKKKRSPLVIKSVKLNLYPDKNLAIFTGKVSAKDDSGIIQAEEMKAHYYSEEERKKNPDLNIKQVECIGNVKIDQVKGEKQALCARAVYDAKSNIVHLEYDPKTGKKVVYRDEVQKWQVEALWMILDRNKNEVTFEGERENQVTVVDFNPDRKSFFGIFEPVQDESPQEPSAEGADEEKPDIGIR
jgi:lipopolysaccharide export system protein LptA